MATQVDTKSEYQFPPFYDYPPYYTLQPVPETRRQQIQSWMDVVLQYCKASKVYRLKVDGQSVESVFRNTKINRQMGVEGQQMILQALVESGSGEWLDKNCKECIILWRKVAEWADELYKWAQLYGYEYGQVVTLPEIVSGDETRDTDLHGIDEIVLTRAIQRLSSSGKAKLFGGQDGQDKAVKFLRPDK